MTATSIEAGMDKIKALMRPLDASQVQVRVGQAGKTKDGKAWAILLAYKDSRADVQRMNEVFGLNWGEEYHHDMKGNLICAVSVWNGREWVTRQDVGTESNQDAEKGQHSDALKRACFRWGVGIELYAMPLLFVWLNKGEYTESNGKVRPKLTGWKLAYEGGKVIVYDKKGTKRISQAWDMLKENQEAE